MSEGGWVKSLLLFFDKVSILLPDYMYRRHHLADPLEDRDCWRCLNQDTGIDHEMATTLAEAVRGLLAGGVFDDLPRGDPFHELSQSRMGYERLQAEQHLEGGTAYRQVRPTTTDSPVHPRDHLGRSRFSNSGPSAFTPDTRMNVAAPGGSTRCGAESMCGRASTSMLAHSGDGGWIPRPGSLAQPRVAVRTSTPPCTSREGYHDIELLRLLGPVADRYTRSLSASGIPRRPLSLNTAPGWSGRTVGKVAGSGSRIRLADWPPVAPFGDRYPPPPSPSTRAFALARMSLM